MAAPTPEPGRYAEQSSKPVITAGWSVAARCLPAWTAPGTTSPWALLALLLVLLLLAHSITLSHSLSGISPLMLSRLFLLLLLVTWGLLMRMLAMPSRAACCCMLLLLTPLLSTRVRLLPLQGYILASLLCCSSKAHSWSDLTCSALVLPGSCCWVCGCCVTCLCCCRLNHFICQCISTLTVIPSNMLPNCSRWCRSLSPVDLSCRCCCFRCCCKWMLLKLMLLSVR